MSKHTDDDSALDLAAGSACVHKCTQGREGQTGSWCVKCGLKIYEVEHRECQRCAHFKDMGVHQIPICTHHMMGVTRTMHVTYALAEGTCFSPNTSVTDAEPSTPANTRAQGPRSV